MDIVNDDVTNVNLEISWRKIERDNTKIGFREGISDGKQANYQESFNKGYNDGFNSGFLMGKYKGSLKLSDLKNNTDTKEELLQSSRKAWCTICKDDGLLEKSIEEIQLLQNVSIKNLFEELDLKYKKTCLE